MYNPKSPHADDFINHEEIEASLRYGEEHKNDHVLIDQLLAKAKACKGLNPQGSRGFNGL